MFSVNCCVLERKDDYEGKKRKKCLLQLCFYAKERTVEIKKKKNCFIKLINFNYT